MNRSSMHTVKATFAIGLLTFPLFAAARITVAPSTEEPICQQYHSEEGLALSGHLVRLDAK